MKIANLSLQFGETNEVVTVFALQFFLDDYYAKTFQYSENDNDENKVLSLYNLLNFVLFCFDKLEYQYYDVDYIQVLAGTNSNNNNIINVYFLDKECSNAESTILSKMIYQVLLQTNIWVHFNEKVENYPDFFEDYIRKDSEEIIAEPKIFQNIYFYKLKDLSTLYKIPCKKGCVKKTEKGYILSTPQILDDFLEKENSLLYDEEEVIIDDIGLLYN